MNQGLTFESVRQELLEILEQTNPMRLHGDLKRAKKLFKLLKILHDLENDDQSPAKQAVTADTVLCEEQDKRNGIVQGQLKRSLVGGYIGSFHVFMPEKRIRELRAEEGDWIRARAFDRRHLPNGMVKVLYEYELLRSAEEAVPTDRVEAKFVRAKYEPYEGMYAVYFVDRDGVERRVLLDGRSVGNLHLDEEQFVDYAYWADQPEEGRISWKYQADFLPLESEHMNALKAQSSELNTLLADHEALAGKRYIYSGEAMPEGLEEEIEAHGGEILRLSGMERYSEIEELLADTDMVILDLETTPHGGLYKFRNACRNVRVPIAYVRKLDREQLLQILLEPPEETMAALTDEDLAEDEE